jgi:hypothetical protein
MRNMRRVPALSRFLIVASISVLAWLTGPVSAHAAIITIDYGDIVPNVTEPTTTTPSYKCGAGDKFNRLCSYLWEAGLELEGSLAAFFGFYGDGFLVALDNDVDSEGSGVPAGGVEFHPRCEPTLAPCFDTFTPLSLDWSVSLHGHGFFVASSRGGLIKSIDDNNGITFTGAEWEDLSWLRYGFYEPDCIDPEDCPVFGNSTISDPELTFATPDVPEPSGLVTLGIVLFGLCRRARRRF